MWSVKLRFLHNKAHRATEWMELNTMHWGIDGTKSDRDSVQNPDASWSKCFVHKSLIKLVNDLCLFMYRQCLLDLHRFFILLCVLLLSVWHYVKVLNLSDLHFPQFFNMVYHVAGLLNRFHLIVLNLMGVMANVLSTPHHSCSASARPVRTLRTRCARHHYVDWKK